jgi:hypothetical protein
VKAVPWWRSEDWSRKEYLGLGAESAQQQDVPEVGPPKCTQRRAPGRGRSWAGVLGIVLSRMATTLPRTTVITTTRRRALLAPNPAPSAWKPPERE